MPGMAARAIVKLDTSPRSVPGCGRRLLAGLVCPSANATTKNREMSTTTRVIRFIGFDLSAQSGLELGAQEICEQQDLQKTARTSVKLRQKSGPYQHRFRR